MGEILRVHFPGLVIISEPSGGGDVLDLEFPKGKYTGETGLCPGGQLRITN
jgi:hypothetical protein